MHIISNKRQVIAALAPIVIFTILTLSSCEVNHFITESSYRRQVESDLDERLSKAEGLRGFFLVDTDRREVTDESLPVGERLLTAKELEALFSGSSFKEDYTTLNREIRKLGYNIPPLVNAYMGLSPTMKLFGTAINYGFGDVEETGILIAIDEIFESKRKRHIDSFIREHRDELELTSGANKIIYKDKN